MFVPLLWLLALGPTLSPSSLVPLTADARRNPGLPMLDSFDDVYLHGLFLASRWEQLWLLVFLALLRPVPIQQLLDVDRPESLPDERSHALDLFC